MIYLTKKEIIITKTDISIMNSNIYFDYLNNDYLSNIELFRYKYEIFLCTLSIIIIGIFSIIFNKMNELNKKLEQELTVLHLIDTIHNDKITDNNNKMIKNYDTLNEENKKLQEEILNLKEAINVHEITLTQNNNKIKDFETETINIQQKIVTCHKKIVSISENNEENKLYSLQLNKKLEQELMDLHLRVNIHEDNLSDNNYVINNQLIFIGYDEDNKSLFVNKNINKLTYLCADSNRSIANTLILSQLRFLNKIKDRLLLSEIAHANLTIYFDDECTNKYLNEKSYPSNNNPLEEKIIKMKYLRFQDFKNSSREYHFQRIEHNIKAIKELKENCIKYDINLILDFENIDKYQKQYFIK